ncbi:DUF1963 domain-containing protein [Afifella marina]|uniref:Uncharacterized protein YwqG n=1 Tax=Afifella marina DSM 2698 TaxID=1120955 RepID=A0A1G5MMW1_AFIMA|nr:DUF1963 domain-containing protein [Afifella marina]SCZ26433.1 Uncharacterized protein YwqG [Afifella marina DSM 2698]
MFDGLAEATSALANWFDPPRLERVVEALAPAIVFKPADAGTRRVGGTHIGGVPDVPEAFVWPRPPMPSDPQEIAARANADMGREMRAHMERGLPYAFIAQMDLQEAEALGEVAEILPPEGRLLFFYDHVTGPWDTGTRAARVIWDTSPTSNLSQARMPFDLAEAAQAELDALADIRHDDAEGTVYAAPQREMKLAATWRLPHPASLDAEGLPELRWDASGDESERFREDYEAALVEYHDMYTEEHWRRQQLLGSPEPEQDDPRLDAAVVSEFAVQHLPPELWRENLPRIKAEAETWTLLLQLDVADWMQARFTEGTVYFLIRRSDLKKRRFDEVVAVYQQT